jgi:hypothetical protein
MTGVRASAGAILPLLATSSAFALESPTFNVTIEDTTTIYTATPASSNVPGFKPHINFPWMTQRGDGSLLTWWTVGQTHGAGVFGLGSESFDDGDTWTTPTGSYPYAPPITLMSPPGQTSLGFTISHYSDTPFTSFAQGRFASGDGGRTWASSTATYHTGAVEYLNLYQNPGTVVRDGSTLMLTAFGQRPGQSTFESVLFASDDNGFNWNRRSTIASYVAGANASMGEEGPNESDIIRLDNGNLLAVYRTGQPFPNSDINAVHPSIFFSLSSDHGQTWTDPKMLGVMGSYPHLNKLDDGTIAMTYGRYGVKVMFADETGTRWTRPTVIHDESTSGYVRMYRRVSDGKYVIAYDHSSFYPPSWDNSAPAGYVYANDQMAHMKVAVLDIERQNVHDDLPWALEYHGDVAPDTLDDQPWSAFSGGGTSGRLWAELGQDYLRLDSGANGVNRHYYYQMDGADGESMWSRMDFANDGAVIDFRARVGSESTAPSAASLFVGDGVNGFVSLELTGSYVGLEGSGGNAGQHNYLESLHPAFRTSDWHDYRLIISPDDGSGGAVLARLFLDGDDSQPILTQLLNPSLVDQIRFGDQTDVNNGILDVDFLRFTRLNMLAGDTDFDGDVDLDDLTTLANHYGDETSATWAMGDFNWDQTVNLIDLTALATNYSAGQAQAMADFQALAANVPEPATLMWFAAGAGLLIRRRHKRSD